jgi:hypothetical protein
MTKVVRQRESTPGKRMLTIVRGFVPNVNKVVDAKKDATVEVLPRDISRAAKKNHNACALARACERTFMVDAAVITPYRAFLIKGDVATRYMLTDHARREIIAFDRGAAFMPGEYDMRAPRNAERIGHRLLGAPTDRKGRKDVSRRAYRVTEGVRTHAR